MGNSKKEVIVVRPTFPVNPLLANIGHLKVGGSMAGLMHAIVFQSLGHSVRVLEKLFAGQLQSQAAGLRVGPEVEAFIDKYIHPIEPFAITLNTISQSDRTGKIQSERTSREPLHLTTWGYLHRMLLNKLLSTSRGENSVFETEVKVENIRHHEGKIQLDCRHQRKNALGKHEADMVIAADGAHSVVRQTLRQDRPTYTGYVTWRGAVPESVMSPYAKQLFIQRVVMLKTNPGYIISQV